MVDTVLGDRPELLMLRDTVRNFVADEASLDQVRAWEEDKTYPQDLFKKMSQLGLMGLPIPEALGGSGAGPVEMILVGEELGRTGTDLAANYALCNFLGLNLAANGTADQHERYLKPVIAGDLRFSLAMTEPNAGSDALAISTRAVRSGDRLVLNGEKVFCTGGGLPDTVLHVACITDPQAGGRDGMSIVLVPNDAPGVQIRRMNTVARHVLGTYEIVFQDVEVPVDNVVGELNHGWEVLRDGLELERIFGCAVYIGCIETVIELISEYVQQRVQFGRPIAEFQAVAHPIVNMHCEAEAARLLTYQAAQLLAEQGHARLAISRAKLFASEAAQRATNTGMQLMGGYGYVREFHMERFWREARIFTVTAGSSEIQRNMIARMLGLTGSSGG